jgi:hypothetical protein
MIDSPANYSGMLQREGGSAEAVRDMDRGYDFTGVVRWYAERADIVCLFFDPDKPGTTGETLSILLHALSGMDHKLLIVLNKADQFEKIHDFARAYGSLCWNLSKVIPRKDLPRIYTMCLPVDDDARSRKAPPPGLQDLHTARDEVVREVRKAPARRMDNVITALYDAVSQLHMHAVLLQDIRARRSRLYWQSKWQEVGVALTGGCLTGLVAWAGGGGVEVAAASGTVPAVVAATTVTATGLLSWYHGSQLTEWERQAVSPEELSAAFQRTHSRAVQEGDEYVAAVWQRIRDNLRTSLEEQLTAGGGMGSLPSVSASDLSMLQGILHHEIPELRRLTSPTHYGKDHHT